jgi:hypothetical protein
MSRLQNRLQHENAEPLALWVAESDSAATALNRYPLGVCRLPVQTKTPNNGVS